MNYRSFNDLSNLIKKNLNKIPRDIDVIVGVPRSGLLVATMIALLLNKRIADFDGFLEGRIIASGRTKKLTNDINSIDDIRKVLIVEDSVSSGESLNKIRTKISSFPNIEFTILAAYVTNENKSMVDIYFETVANPRLFEWNLFHHKGVLCNSCFDIDGVLCVDPTPEENDDGERYRSFLLNASPLFIPSCEIGYIVSSRLEKYRLETEEWLRKNGIRYKKLFLLDSTAKERREQNLYYKFKAEIYKKTDAILFIESNDYQAEEINRLTKKPVFCVDSNRMLNGGVEYRVKNEMKESVSDKTNMIKRKLKKISFIRFLHKRITRR